MLPQAAGCDYFGGTLPLGVTGNTPDSGSGESWFEPRRGNLDRRAVRPPVFVCPSGLAVAYASPSSPGGAISNGRGASLAAVFVAPPGSLAPRLRCGDAPPGA